MQDDRDIPAAERREQAQAERGRALVTGAAAQVHAGEDLRERIAGERVRLRPVRRRRTLGLAGSLTAAVAAVAAAVVLVVPGGEEDPPGTLQTARLIASAVPTLPAPPRDTGNRVLLRAGLDGVPFPQWEDRFGYRAVGARRDRVSGRPALTVFYEGHYGIRTAYTILAGRPIAAPAGAYRRTVNGTELAVVEDRDRRVVTWTRDGHSCVLSAPERMDEAGMLQLAAWDAGGDVPF